LTFFFDLSRPIFLLSENDQPNSPRSGQSNDRRNRARASEATILKTADRVLRFTALFASFLTARMIRQVGLAKSAK
jgi:hypothetical protein